MKKGLIWTIIIVLVIAVVGVGVYFLMPKDSGSKLAIESEEDLKKLIDDVYAGVTAELPGSETEMIDASDADMITNWTGLTSNENVEYVAVSMPMISSQAYQVTAIKAKAGSDIEAMKQEMLDNLNMHRWICVTADKLYITNCGDVIFFVMADSEWADPVYDAFKVLVENDIGKELSKTEEEDDADFELPPEILADPVLDGDFDEGIDEPATMPDAYVEPLVSGDELPETPAEMPVVE